MKKISFEELKDMQDEGEDFVLINVLPGEVYDEGHIPESINVPLQDTEFEKEVENAVDGKDREIVVYCASYDCDASKKAAEKLEKAGFTDVIAYEGGFKEWQERSGSGLSAA